MLHQHTQDPTLVHRTEWTATTRRDFRFWGYLALTAVLATLVPVATAVGVNIADSGWFRLLLAIAISAAAALAVLASPAASAQAAPEASKAPKAPRRARRTHC